MWPVQDPTVSANLTTGSSRTRPWCMLLLQHHERELHFHHLLLSLRANDGDGKEIKVALSDFMNNVIVRRDGGITVSCAHGASYDI